MIKVLYHTLLPVTSLLTWMRRELSGQSENFSLKSMVSMFWLTLPNRAQEGRVADFIGRPPISSAVDRKRKYQEMYR